MRLGLGVKRFLVQVMIASAKAGAFLLAGMSALGRVVAFVLAPAWRVLIRGFGVPLYRAFFWTRRLLPKHTVDSASRVGRVLAGRSFVGWCMGGCVLLIVGMNMVQAEALRNPDAGQRSALYRFLTHEQTVTYTVRAEPTFARPTRYLSYVFLASPESIAQGKNENDPTVTTDSGTLVAPMVSGTADSVAPRSEVLTHTIASGETLGSIAQKYGLSLSTILWANNLTARSVLKIGNALTILPVDGVVHTVKKGETAAAIAKKYKVETDKVLAFNGLGGAALRVGATLIIPGGTPPVVVPPKSARSIANVFTSSPVSSKTGVAGSGRMLWPTDLHIITQKFGWKHTGIDIDCYFNNTNYAADDGTVQYAGWKKGYGYVVEINHGNGMVTRYGHHAKLYVSAGQPIARGTPIGLCGTTGKSSGTHLHFEVIIGGKFRNPLEYVR